MGGSKKDAIIRATIQLVSENGFHGAPSIKVAKRAGVAEVTVFRNFQTKERLFEVIFDELLLDVQTFVSEGHDTSRPIKERFFELCHRFCSYMKQQSGNMNYMEQYLHSPEGWAKRPDMIHESNVAFEEYPLIALLDQGRRENALKNLPMPVLVGLVIGTLVNFEREQQLKKVTRPEEIEIEVIQACWNGISR